MDSSACVCQCVCVCVFVLHAQQHLEQQWPGAAVCLWFCTAGHQRTGTVLLRSRRAPANSTRLTAGQPGGPSSTTAGGPASEDGSL
ncbi:unnamed protein product [Gadus morhua 'NCC']